MPHWNNQPWQRNLSKTASDKPGAVHPKILTDRRDRCGWISEEGQMLSIANIATIFRLRIKEWLGEEHGPHIARKWLRSSASRRSPQAAFETAVVLGHSPMVSLRYYAEATDRQAGRRHAENLGQLRKQTKGIAERLFGEA
jgi:hypothetical protein